ncbi:MAG: TrkH family potassium uptake protein [Proteocatella sp.]
MKKGIAPAQIIILGFLVMILFGALLLMLPLSSTIVGGTSFINALFTSTSAVCVTGLVVVDTGTFWSGFGKFVIISLIQIGGLGFMTITTFGAIVVGKKIGIKNRLLIKESLGQNTIQGIVNLTKKIFLGTVIIEVVGALLLATQFIPIFGFKDGIIKSIFHSISAFCNAGFDIMGNFESLTRFQSNIVLNVTIMLLIILGGIGFTVIIDYGHERKFKRISLHSKIAISMTVFLLIFGTLVIFGFERNNPLTLGGMNLFDKIMGSAFQSVSPRTAGFNSIDLVAMTDSSKFFMLLLMFIGGSPASTAGGIKTTTIAVLILTTVAFVRNKDVEAFGRRINYRVVNKAMTIMVIALLVIITGAMLLSILNPELEFMDLLFEVVSAFGTVGLTLEITTKLTSFSKLVIIFIMFAGRVGALTIVMALAGRDKRIDYQLPEGSVIL